MPVGRVEDFLAPEGTGGWHVAVLGTAASSNGIYSGSDRVPNPTSASTRFRQISLQAAWQATDTLRVSAFVPFVWIRKREIGAAPINLSGLGDASLITEWRPFARPFAGGEAGDHNHEEAPGAGVLLEGLPGAAAVAHDHEEEHGSSPAAGLFLIAGIKAPTGQAATAPAPGLVPPSLLQLGTGTWDPIFGAGWRGSTGDWSFFARAVAQTPIGASDADLNPGDLLELSAGAGMAVLPGLTASLSADAVFRTHDYLLGSQLASTGSSIFFLSPAITYQPAGNLIVAVGARVPVSIQVNGMQIVPGVRWIAEIGVSF